MKKIKKLLQRVNFKALQKEIKGYGFEFSFNKYMTNVVLILAGMIGVSFFFRLEVPYIAFLVLFGIMVLPIIVVSQIKNLYHLQKFEEASNYMTQMLISFKLHPKILNALRDTADLSSGTLKDKINETVDFITNDINGEDTYYEGLRIMEREYPNSRVHALHRFMITVETENSKNFIASADDLYSDIEGWTERTFIYRQDLKMTKSKVIMSIVLALVISLVLVIGLPANLTGFTASPIYQIITSLLIMFSLGVYCFVQSKLNGQWLLYDLSKNREEDIVRNIEYVRNYDFKAAKKKKLIKTLMFVPIVVMGVVLQNTNILVIGGLGAVFGYFQSNMAYNSKKKAIENQLKMEFPLWLRDIALNLHNYVVTRAIRNSYETAPAVMKPYLNDFIDEMDLDPNSIVPYQNFLAEFNIPDLTNSMRTLYSIKQLGDASDVDCQRQITSLIMRNQKMLAGAEKIRNDNSLSGIGFISLSPVLVASVSLIADMILLMMDFMSQVSIG